MSGDELGDMILELWEDDSKRFLENREDDSKRFLENREGKSLLSKMEHDILLKDNDGVFESMDEKEIKRQIMRMRMDELSKKEDRKLWKNASGGRKRKSRKSRRSKKSKKSKKGRRTRRRK